MAAFFTQKERTAHAIKSQTKKIYPSNLPLCRDGLRDGIYDWASDMDYYHELSTDVKPYVGSSQGLIFRAYADLL